jgi:DNA-binding response OmpR family regulator
MSNTEYSTQDNGQSIKKLLLVEDDPVIMKLYKTKFEQAGLKVLTADNGSDGLRIALEDQIDLILLDLMMPQMSGFDLLTELRKDENKKDLPVIVLSNITDEGEKQKAYTLGVKEYLSKPTITPTQIIEVLKKYI